MTLSFRMYAYIAVALAVLAAGFYVSHLRNTVERQSQQIVVLEATVSGLKKGLAAVEETNRKRLSDKQEMGDIKQEVEREEDAPLPAPIERALDGLRKHQSKH